MPRTLLNSEIKIDFTKPILFKAGWNCCYGVESMVIVFDNGARWAVCHKCAYSYSGPIYSLFVFNSISFVEFVEKEIEW